MSTWAKTLGIVDTEKWVPQVTQLHNPMKLSVPLSRTSSFEMSIVNSPHIKVSDPEGRLTRQIVLSLSALYDTDSLIIADDDNDLSRIPHVSADVDVEDTLDQRLNLLTPGEYSSVLAYNNGNDPIPFLVVINRGGLFPHVVRKVLDYGRATHVFLIDASGESGPGLDDGFGTLLGFDSDINSVRISDGGKVIEERALWNTEDEEWLIEKLSL